jgi:D-alanyl-D-alanine carboxypeptidase/D-alanyl-D-alanine-endopeptidase (penicillin-binding protein 4)
MKKMLHLLLIMQFHFGIQAQLNFEKLPELDGASISYMVRDLHTGKLIASHDTSKVLAPASVLKLFTTALSLDKLGSKTTIKSTFYITGKIDNGVLVGNLIFDANYNPVLLSSRYNRSISKMTDKLISSLKQLGINSVQGDIKVFEDVLPVNSLPRTWIWEDIGNYYGTGAGRTVLNENVLNIYLKSGAVGSKVEVVRTEPNLPWLVLDSKVTSSKINRDLAYCFSRPADKKITITGTIPANRSGFVVKASLPDPSGALAFLLKKELETKGFKVSGNTKVIGQLPVQIKELLVFNSPGVSSIIRKTNKQSINVYAETLLNLIHQKKGNQSETRTEFMKRSLGEKFDTKTMKLYDGSGMSRFNAVSSKQVVDLISWMNSHESKTTFYESFAVAGESGTLKSMLANTIAKGRVKGKSGSMDGVRAYAGTINTRKGENFAFSVIVNNYVVSNSVLKKILEKWLWELWSNN